MTLVTLAAATYKDLPKQYDMTSKSLLKTYPTLNSTDRPNFALYNTEDVAKHIA